MTEYVYDFICTRRGTFSSAALDPEEYYGSYETKVIGMYDEEGNYTEELTPEQIAEALDQI